MFPGFPTLQGAPSYGCTPFSPFQGLPAAPNPVQLQQLQQLQQLNAFGLGGVAPIASSPADWSRIHELGASSSRQAGSSSASAKPPVSGPVPTPRGSGYSLHNYPGYGTRPKFSATPPIERPNGNPYKVSSTMQAVLDRLEAEANAEEQL